MRILAKYMIYIYIISEYIKVSDISTVIQAGFSFRVKRQKWILFHFLASIYNSSFYNPVHMNSHMWYRRKVQFPSQTIDLWNATLKRQREIVSCVNARAWVTFISVEIKIQHNRRLKHFCIYISLRIGRLKNVYSERSYIYIFDFFPILAFRYRRRMESACWMREFRANLRKQVLKPIRKYFSPIFPSPSSPPPPPSRYKLFFVYSIRYSFFYLQSSYRNIYQIVKTIKIEIRARSL